ncbi:MAG TPA: ABC transporter permease [Ramlibacter sp.]|nr:ABC transporter permease [Ramlibacter sp.]
MNPVLANVELDASCGQAQTPFLGRNAPADSAPHSRRPMPGWVISALSVAFTFLAWFVVTNAGWVPEDFLPKPQTLASTFRTLVAEGYQGTSLWGQIGISLFRTLTGFVIGAVLGILVGLAAGYFRVLAAALNPILAFIRPVPPIAFIPLVVLYFGLGETGKITLIALTAFNYTVVNAQAGALSTPRAFRRAAATLGLKPWQEFVRVVFPAALPSIFTGLRVALALSWAVVVAAELVGAQSGLGFMVSNAALLLQVSVVFIGIGLIGLVGLLLNGVILLAERKIVHWAGR